MFVFTFVFSCSGYMNDVRMQLNVTSVSIVSVISNTGLLNLIHTNTNSLTAGLRTSEKQCSAYGRSGNIFTGSSDFRHLR